MTRLERIAIACGIIACAIAVAMAVSAVLSSMTTFPDILNTPNLQ